MKKNQSINIHIGYPKTGTTSVQSFLARNKKFLKGKGYHYLHSEKLTKSLEIPILIAPEKCNYLINQLKNNKVYNSNFKENLINEINFQLDKGHSIIISNEAFVARFDKLMHIEKLKFFFEQFGVPINIIIYLRRQDEFIVSVYSTQIKGGKFNSSLDEYKKSKLPYYRYLDYCKLVEDWGSVFGLDNLILKIFERDKLIDNDIIADFLSIFDMDKNEIKNGTISENQSLDRRKIQLIQNIFKQNQDKVKLNQRILVKLVQLLEPMPSKDKVALPDDKRMAILNKYAKSNEKLGKQYFNLNASPFNNKYSSLSDDEKQNLQITSEESYELFYEILVKTLG